VRRAGIYPQRGRAQNRLLAGGRCADNRCDVVSVQPYSLDIESAAQHFGLAKNTLYAMTVSGELQRGRHYLKFGRKTLIIREAFIEFLRERDGSICETRNPVRGRELLSA